MVGNLFTRLGYIIVYDIDSSNTDKRKKHNNNNKTNAIRSTLILANFFYIVVRGDFIQQFKTNCNVCIILSGLFILVCLFRNYITMMTSLPVHLLSFDFFSEDRQTDIGYNNSRTVKLLWQILCFVWKLLVIDHH